MMDARPLTWTIVSVAMILALLLSAVMPGLPVGGARAAAQDAGGSPVTPHASIPVAVGPAVPQTEETLYPVADATIIEGSSTNYGGDPLLWAQMGYYQSDAQSAPAAGTDTRERTSESLLDWTPTLRALLKFDLPADVVIDAARLGLLLNKSGTPDSVVLRAYQVTSAWSEMTVTGNNQPARGTLYAQTNVGMAAAWYSWDITQIARAWQQGSNYGLLLEPAQPTTTPWFRAFFSRDNREGMPRLVLTYHLRNYTLYAPPTGRPGAELPVAGQDFIPGAPVILELVAGDSTWTCGSASADAAGVLRSHCAVPPAAPIGPATLNARAVNDSLLASTAVQIVAGPALQLSPTSGLPGTVVQYTATNLIAGSLRLDYAGVPLVGPLPVATGAANGSFVVPADRPSPLGSATVVKAVNLAGGVTAGAVEAAFQSQIPTPMPNFQFMSASASGGTLIPGEDFKVTGLINPVAGIAGQGYHVLAIWEDGAGHSAPIHLEPGTVAADGSFMIRARAPSLRMGDAWSSAGASAPGQLRLTLRKSGLESGAGLLKQYTGPHTPALQVNVISSASGQPIPNALVRITEPDTLPTAIHDHTNQIAEYAKTFWGDNALKAFICSNPWSQVTTPAGSALVTLPHAEALEVNPWFDALKANGYDGPTIPHALIDASPASVLVPPPENPPVGPQWKHYRIIVDALLAGYGLPGVPGQWLIYDKELYFNTETGEIQDAWRAPFDNPLEVMLDPIPSEQIPFPFSPYLELGTQMAPLEAGTVPPTYGKFLSFKGQVTPNIDHPWLPTGLGFVITDQQHSLVASASAQLDGQNAATPTWTSTGGAGLCDPDPPVAEKFWHASWNLGYPDLPAGLHELKVTVKLTTGAEVVRRLQLHLVDAPAWFMAATADRRWAEMDQGGYWLGEDLIGGAGSLDASTTGDQTPNSGAITNKAKLVATHTERIGFAGSATVQAGYSATGMTLLNSAAKNVSGQGPGQAAAMTAVQAASSPDASYTIPIQYGPAELFNTGTLPLMQAAVSVLEIVTVSVGAEGGSSANLEINGTVTVGDGAPNTDLIFKPQARLWGTYWVAAALLEVVAKAKLSIWADLDSRLTLRVQDSVALDNACFKYRGSTTEWGGLICIPIIDECVVEGETTQHWPAINVPPGCSAAATSNASEAAATLPAPPMLDPALASDGFGHSIALWPEGLNAVTATTYDGIAWGAPATIATGPGPVAPRVAYTAPNRAVAVWAESSLLIPALPDPPLSVTAAYTDVVRTYHIATSTWDGAGWSAAQDLTIPGAGEGQVALAACPATTSGCPAGGAATAVWVRDVAGAPAQRRFRLFYATYQNSAWSTPLPVDANSSATDMQPSVAYRLGKPMVAWVRDADRNVATTSDRRIVWRLLDGVSPVQTPGDLPNNIVYLALGIDSTGAPHLAFTRMVGGVGLLDNRHLLGRARGTCPADGAACIWSWNTLQDSRGRAIHAEQPRLTIDKLDRPTLTYRALGFGPDPAASPHAYPEDTIGVTTRTGDLAQVELPAAMAAPSGSAVTAGSGADVTSIRSGQAATVSPTYLTADGAVNWEPLAVYDALNDTTLALAVRGAAPALSAAMLAALPQRANVAQTLAAGQPIVMANVARLPDFAVVTATISSRYPQAAEPLSLNVVLRNEGVDWQSAAGRPLNIVATWDGGPGLGAEAASTTLASLVAGQVVILTLPLIAPPPIALGATGATYAAPHTLTVTANPNQVVAERNGANNEVTLPVGGLPAPAVLTAATASIATAPSGSAPVFLGWSAPVTGAITGYRVYRAADGGPSVPVGSSFVIGWMDVTAQPGHRYRYIVTSYAANGLESEPSQTVEVQTPQETRKVYLPILLKAR